MIYYELALVVNKEMYDDKKISYMMYQNTERYLLEKLKNLF